MSLVIFDVDISLCVVRNGQASSSEVEEVAVRQNYFVSSFIFLLEVIAVAVETFVIRELEADDLYDAWYIFESHYRKMQCPFSSRQVYRSCERKFFSIVTLSTFDRLSLLAMSTLMNDLHILQKIARYHAE